MPAPLSHEELEAAHCWENDDRVPGPLLDTRALTPATTKALRERYLPT